MQLCLAHTQLFTGTSHRCIGWGGYNVQPKILQTWELSSYYHKLLQGVAAYYALKIKLAIIIDVIIARYACGQLNYSLLLNRILQSRRKPNHLFFDFLCHFKITKMYVHTTYVVCIRSSVQLQLACKKGSLLRLEYYMPEENFQGGDHFAASLKLCLL